MSNLPYNVRMPSAFMQYYACKTKARPITPSCLAHRILYVEAHDKVLEMHYLDNADRKCSFIVSGDSSLSKIETEHKGGFIKANRSVLVSIAAITAIFKTSDSEYCCSIIGTNAILSISRRQLKAVCAAYAEIHNGV